MPLEVPFRPSIVLAIVVAVAVVVDIVYVVVSRGRPLSLPSSNPHGSENPLAAKHRAFYVRSTEFFSRFSSGTSTLIFPDRTRVRTRVVHARRCCRSLLSWDRNARFPAYFASSNGKSSKYLGDQVGANEERSMVLSTLTVSQF